VIGALVAMNVLGQIFPALETLAAPEMSADLREGAGTSSLQAASPSPSQSSLRAGFNPNLQRIDQPDGNTCGSTSLTWLLLANNIQAEKTEMAKTFYARGWITESKGIMGYGEALASNARQILRERAPSAPLRVEGFDNFKDFDKILDLAKTKQGLIYNS